VTLNDSLDLLIYHVIEIRRRPAPDFFDQKRAIITDFTSSCPDLTISPSLIIPKEEFFTSAFRYALGALRFFKKRGYLYSVPSPKSKNNQDLG
jgi:hypothetical protein